MEDQDFASESYGLWRLYLVDEEEGENPDHYFYKFVAIPAGCGGNGKRSCLRRGWEHIGDFSAVSATNELEDLLSEYKDGELCCNCYHQHRVYHVHIGLMMSELSA